MRIVLNVDDIDRAVTRITRKLDHLERGAYLQPVADTAANLLENEMRRYPPKLPHSSYRRTMALQQSWTREVTRGGSQGGWVAQVGTRLKYAPYVQDATWQAEVHQGRWKTIQSVAKDKKDEVFKFVVRAIRGWLAKG